MLFRVGGYEWIVDRFFVSEGGKKYQDIFYMPEHLGAVLAWLSGNRSRRLHTSGAVVLLPVIVVTLIARHASLPVAAGLSPNGELPHRLLCGPRSQFGRLTVLPRPGQPFPRSLAQERGFLPVRRRKVRRRNRTGVRQAA
ncbi:hypothetical protein [Burkholderia stabilis]|uniref:hypothetical protein n=1 Tax=Burkholderia stabilis TaxID=95485 RepID=UPI0010110D89|nr:hypothetical protein [Burkholderia stabilis]